MSLSIRRARPDDAEELLKLYNNHLAAIPPEGKPDLARAHAMLARFAKNPGYHLLVGEHDGNIVSSVTLIILENLTHGIQPYAIIENVVTHADFRGRGYASALLARAREIAVAAGCYKIMLMTSSKQEGTLGFYEKNGFSRGLKTAFLMRL